MNFTLHSGYVGGNTLMILEFRYLSQIKDCTIFMKSQVLKISVHKFYSNVDECFTQMLQLYVVLDFVQRYF